MKQKTFHEVLATTTGLFRIRLSWGPGLYLICDDSKDPHLRKNLGKVGPKTNRKRLEFLIYPEPGKKSQFRIQLSQYMNGKYVESSGNDGPFKPWAGKKASDNQLFRFRLQSDPAKVPADAPKGVDWYFIERVAGNQVLTWGGLLDRYAHAMTTAENARDSSKVWFEPITTVKVPNRRQPKPTEVDPPIGVTDPVFRGQDVIPAALVNVGGHSFAHKGDQIDKSPYYYLDLEKFWEKSGPAVDVDKGRDFKETVSHTTNYKREDSRSIEKTVGHTFGSELEVGAKHAAGPYGSLKLSYELSSQVKNVTGVVETREAGVVRTKEMNIKSTEGHERHQAWKMVHRYTLRTSDGKIADTWSYADPESIGWIKKTV